MQFSTEIIPVACFGQNNVHSSCGLFINWAATWYQEQNSPATYFVTLGKSLTFSKPLSLISAMGVKYPAHSFHSDSKEGPSQYLSHYYL